MKLLADENVDAVIVTALRNAGHQVRYVLELDPEIDDRSVLALANADEAMVLTSDKDFGELVFRQQLVNAGVILYRLAGLSPNRKAAILVQAIEHHASEMLGAFVLIGPGLMRIRLRPHHPRRD
jgi:predicted nuclease of predicted toxin-antitoxin system